MASFAFCCPKPCTGKGHKEVNYKMGSMLKSIIKFARIRIIATCFALVFLGSAAAGGITAKTILAFILIVTFTVHANSINDYADKDIDAINLKEAHDRPLVTKDISSQQFWIIH